MTQSNILQSLKKEKKELELRLAKVSKAILALEPIPIQYMQWRIKADKCINNAKCYLQTHEILECLLGEMTDKELRRKYINALSVALTYMCKDDELKKFKVKKRKGDFYGLPTWFNADGTPQDEYLGSNLNIGNRNIKDLLRA